MTRTEPQRLSGSPRPRPNQLLVCGLLLATLSSGTASAKDRPAPRKKAGYLGNAAGPSAAATPPASEVVSDMPIGAPDWILSVSGLGGWVNNEVNISFEMQGREGLEEKTVSLSDSGWGPGLVAVGSYKRFVWTNVLYFFRDVNHSWMLGGVTHLCTTIPTPIFIKPYFAAGLFFMTINTHLTNYQETELGQLSDGTLTKGIASFDEINIKNRILTPMPEVGLRVDIPIQHWYVTPYYSFWYDDVLTRASSPGGKVEVFKRDQTDLTPDNYAFPKIPIDGFDEKRHRGHSSHIVGAWLSMDYNYFLRLQANVYYNVSYDLFSTRLIGTALLSKYVGLMGYFEYQELIPVNNIYFFLGPVFTLFPSGYIDRIMARRPKT